MRLVTTLAAALLCATAAQAENIQLTHQDLVLNANLESAGEDDLTGRSLVLISHGTLAHGRMELVSALQNTLAEYDIASLAPTLSLGISDRQGMYDCSTPHTHHHEDAVAELALWLEWLEAQGAERILLLGHSRGGNQAALLSQETDSTALMGQVLLAPMTWNAEAEAKSYAQRYGQPLAPLLQQAKNQATGPLPDPVDFLYCEDAKVNADTFVSYYSDQPSHHTPSLLQNTQLPTLVIAGTADQVVPDLSKAMETVTNPTVETASIDGASHFFRDLYTYDVVDLVEAFMEAHP
ncbi:alpha/beta hydrolase [Marinobacterium stanieri]|uniref:Lysophospholipase, alpha-beta hydrolase superfamily n=1 Tax=Marinobacterium stanieri TaxID=49186 RepID=A0A1N6PXU7_9GAMM|nr:alpha/beta hydrolase [Marinobacterium stanieri]SIQ09106.1 Lysophospholipase, alpha-beta hydrolase superfamily [Marinobacterium stanieri]